MSDFVPTTEQVRQAYEVAHEEVGASYEPDEFDRWLAAVERDAALEAIERVRAIHYPFTPQLCYMNTRGGQTPMTSVHCHHCKPEGSGMVGDPDTWPCQTIQALDGAPEPEWEYVGVAFEHGGFMRIRNDQLVPEKFESWRKLMTKYPRVEILKRVKAVPAGPWLPVEGESKP